LVKKFLENYFLFFPFLVTPALGDSLVNFTVINFKKGAGNIVTIECLILVKQSHDYNEVIIRSLLRSNAITYFNEGDLPKNL
jgi:hypothetical protein